ncbi:MAG: DUF86 domain-containing protein [Gammaproteobacteria bacterium]|nr:DUF86 domain-containing protein [Gammaproteobacteria bacterium]
MKRDEVYLQHVLDAINRIIEYTAEGKDVFFKNTMVQDAVIRNLEVIGEATKALSEEIRRKHSDIPWDGMAGMRDILIHHYMGVDLEIVWDVSQSKLEDLRSQIQSVLQASD